jgi:hypothetical protein
MPGSSGRAVGGRRLVMKSTTSGAPSKRRTTTAMTIVSSGFCLLNLAGAGTRCYLTNQIDYMTEWQNTNAVGEIRGKRWQRYPRTRRLTTHRITFTNRLFVIFFIAGPRRLPATSVSRQCRRDPGTCWSGHQRIVLPTRSQRTRPASLSHDQ